MGRSDGGGVREMTMLEMGRKSKGLRRWKRRGVNHSI